MEDLHTEPTREGREAFRLIAVIYKENTRAIFVKRELGGGILVKSAPFSEIWYRLTWMLATRPAAIKEVLSFDLILIFRINAIKIHLTYI